MSESSQDEESDSRQNWITDRLNGYLNEIGIYMRLTRAQMILRRYFAMNAFDGSMTSLGVVIGAYITDIVDPMAVIGVIMVSGIAMAVSGFSGTYMTESAERNRSLNELEEAMLTDLDDTIYGEASRFIAIFAAFVDGSAPFLASLPAVIPFYLSYIGFLPNGFAFVGSIGASLLTLFLLGVFLGKVSDTNVFTSGVKMVIAGVAVAILALLLNVH